MVSIGTIVFEKKRERDIIERATRITVSSDLKKLPMHIPMKMNVDALRNRISDVLARVFRIGTPLVMKTPANKTTICTIRINSALMYMEMTKVASEVGVIKFLKYARVLFSLDAITDAST